MSGYETTPVDMCIACEVRRDVTHPGELLEVQYGVEQILRASDEQYHRYIYGGWEGFDEFRNLIGASERYAESALACAKRHKAGECIINFSEVGVEINQ